MTKKDFSVSVIIPSHNGEKFLNDNLPKIISAWDNSKNKIKEVVVVDDGSEDSSALLIKSKFSKIRLIKHSKNRGIPASINTGVRSSKGDLVLVLANNLLPEKDFLVSALKHFEDPKVFSVALHEKGCGWVKAKFAGGYLELENMEESKESKKTFYVNARSGIFRRKIWIEIGGMDEKILLPNYWQDVDICFRAAKRGFQNLWEPKSVVTQSSEANQGGFLGRNTGIMEERNRLLFVWKNIGSRALIRKHISGLFTRILKHPGYIRIVIMVLGKLGEILKTKRRLRKENGVSDEAIFSRFA